MDRTDKNSRFRVYVEEESTSVPHQNVSSAPDLLATKIRYLQDKILPKFHDHFLAASHMAMSSNTVLFPERWR